MKVLIVGSTEPAQEEPFANLCRDLGEALARAGHEIVVGASAPNTADRYAIEGVSRLPGRNRVWVIRPDDEGSPFGADLIAPLGNLDFVYRRTSGTRAAGRVPQILASDAVILVGGSHGTAQVGYVAPVLGRAVLAIASFGGAAAELWPQLSFFYEGLGPLSDRVGSLREDSRSVRAELCVQIVEELVRRGKFKSNRPKLHVWILVLEIILLSAWVFLFVNPPSPNVVAFFVLLGTSAFLGTCLRNTLLLVAEPAAELPWSRIVAEVNAGLILAFGLAVIYLAGGFTITGKFDFISSSTQPGDFQRVAIAMTILGLAGGWLIEPVGEGIKQWLLENLPRQRSR